MSAQEGTLCTQSSSRDEQLALKPPEKGSLRTCPPSGMTSRICPPMTQYRPDWTKTKTLREPKLDLKSGVIVADSSPAYTCHGTKS